ncbi:hypothetical protein [Roseateles chitinivorans]|uniref:hypothetical protein n=1 Tax=Roseateles chitinivorans TaxID=2917965 RepID=UPI003D6710F4
MNGPHKNDFGMRIMRMQGANHRLLAIAAALGLMGGSAAADTTTSPADQSNYSRTIQYSYEADTGRPSSTTTEPDRPALCKRTTVAYDAWGNLTRSTESHCDAAPARVRVKPASTQTKFDAVVSQSFTASGATVSMAIPAGMFAITNENALTHRTTTGFDPRFGIPISIKDPNNVVSRIDLDDFGRTIRAVAPNGTSVVTYYCALPAAGVDTSANTTGCPEIGSPERPEAAVSFTHVEARDTKDRKSGAFVRTYVDALGRTIRVATESFDGTQQPAGRSGAMVVSDTVFGPQGQKLLQTSAYFLESGSSTLAGSRDVGVSAFEYDDLGRVVLTASSNPNGQSQRTFGSGNFGYGSYGSRAAARTIVSFSAATTKTTDPQERVSQVELNGLRQISRVTDRGGAQLAYRYDAFGLVVETRDALQNLSSTTYDIVGRVVAVDDPDKGLSQSCLDILGRSKFTQTSNQRGGHVAASCPDVDASEITAPVQQKWTTHAYDVLGRKTQERSSGDVYTWSYDSGTGAVGRLSKSTTAQGVTKQYYYDDLGRAVSSRTDILQGPSFASSVSYDNESGRLDTKTYPTGLKVGYVYTARGFLTALRTKSALNLRPMPATPGGTRPDQGTLLSADSVLWSAQTLRADGGIEKTGFSSNVTATTVADAIGRMGG